MKTKIDKQNRNRVREEVSDQSIVGNGISQKRTQSKKKISSFEHSRRQYHKNLVEIRRKDPRKVQKPEVLLNKKAMTHL